MQTEADERLASAGQFSTNPLKIEGDLTLKKWVLKKYLPYVETLIDFDVQEGQLAVDTGFNLSQNESRVFEVFGNLIMKVIASPFKFLCAMSGGERSLVL